MAAYGAPVQTGRGTAIAGKTVVAAAGTPVVLGSKECGDGVTIIANKANVGNIYVYPAAGFKADVFPLAPGDSMFWGVSKLTALKVDVDTSGDSVYWHGVV